MADEFTYDVFLSHSSKDKAIVRDIAERLRDDGLRVWLDEWVLKPGDNSAEVFTIKDARYWKDQAFPVLLVIRSSEGEVRWMEVRDYLRSVSDDGKKPVRQIVFEGERFDVMSVRRWRDRALKQ